MNWDSPALSEEWRKFKQHAELVFQGPLRSTKEDEKCCYLLIWVGEKGRDIFNTWVGIPAEDRSRLDTYYIRFDEWVKVKENPIYARSKFYERRQSPGEPLEQFVAEMSLLAQDCCFVNTEEMIRDRLVCGVYLQEVRQKMINEGPHLCLNRALEIARICEITQGRLEDVYRDSPFMDYKPPWLKRRALERSAREEVATPIESCDESGSSLETEEALDFSETEQMDQEWYLKLIPMCFEDVAFLFSDKEWETLQQHQKQLYKDMMQENYKTLVSLGYDFPKPELVALLEEGKMLCSAVREVPPAFVPIDEDITEAFLLSLIPDDDYDSDPNCADDRDSTDDSVGSVPDLPEPLMANGPIIAQKRVSDDSTVFVREITMNGRQWNVTVNCIATKPVGPDREKKHAGLAAETGLLSKCLSPSFENFVRVNGRTSPASCQRAITPDPNQQTSLFGKTKRHNYSAMVKENEKGFDARPNLKADSVQQKLKPFNNNTEHVDKFHLGAHIPLLLNIKQEEDPEKGLVVDAQLKQLLPFGLDIKEEPEAIPIQEESSQTSTATSSHQSVQRKRGYLQKDAESDSRSHSDSESSRRHSTRIKGQQPESATGQVGTSEESDQSDHPGSERAAPARRKRKSNDDALAKNDSTRKRGRKPRDPSVQRPALKSRLPEEQVPLAVQKMYRCSKCQRTFSHYSQFIAHQRYEMKKMTQNSESVKGSKADSDSSEPKEAEETVETLGEASTSQRVTRSGKNVDDSKNKENDSSKGQRLRERKSFTCNICKETFTSKSSMVVHKGDNDEEVYNCTQCEESEGQATPGGTKYECGICQKTFAHRTGLVAHLRIHTGDKPHQCSECQQTFSYKSALIVHQRIHKKEKEKEKPQDKVQEKVQEPMRTIVPIVKSPVSGMVRTYQCPQCKEQFANSTLLFTHQQTHTGPKPHQCQYCDKSFNDKSLLTVHLKTHTGESPYQCGKCQKTFTSQSLLVSHSLTHSTGKPFQCTMCEKSFNGEALLISHQRTHTGEKTFLCGQCKETFKSEALLAEHQKVHMEDRPHKCDYCEKGFNSQTLLVAHRRIHTGEKAFHCHYCGEGFNTSSLLNVHLRNHAPEKPYPCDLCERSFNLKSLQQAHRATHDLDK
ncbi:hypothetical protein NDU88_003928 [Pleurodeles waltl]|uniref:Uncharacterized protein n=2 Tax=Pleurodeles waltl TaxID=8319 RepID=A0AAV7M4W3_PLEWA|nr:hypothetical protein NDU88_003928 [Pleurodeles waltl]